MHRIIGTREAQFGTFPAEEHTYAIGMLIVIAQAGVKAEYERIWKFDRET